MAAAPEDDAARLAWHAALADATLWLWLEREATGADIAPRVFETGEGPLVLAYDAEERLAEAAGAPVPYAALPGRVVARALAGQGVALGVNLGAGAGEHLMGPEALDWLVATLEAAPLQEAQGRPVAFSAPDAGPALLAALAPRLAGASAAMLARARYDDGREGLMLALTGVEGAAQAAVARAVAEAVALGGSETVDVVFLDPGSAAARAMAGAALHLDLTPPAPPVHRPPPAPGTVSGRPPKLR